MTSINRTLRGKSSNQSVVDFNIVGEILQSPRKFFDEIRDGVDLSTKIVTLAFSAIVFFPYLRGDPWLWSPVSGDQFGP